MLSYTWIGCAYNHLFLYLQDCYNAPTFSPLNESVFMSIIQVQDYIDTWS